MAAKKEVVARNVGTSTSVSRQYFEGKVPTTPEQVTNQEINVRTFVTQPATVSIAKGLTINLGNFESARLNVEIALPCYVEEIDDAYKFADSWVESRLEAEVQSVRANKPSLF